MRFLLNVNNIGGSDWLYGYNNCAVVDIESQQAEVILKRRDLLLSIQEEYEDLYNVEYWDYSPQYIGSKVLDALTREYERDLSNNGFIPLPKSVKLPEDDKYFAMECGRMSVTSDGIYWVGYLKHTENMSVETVSLPYSEIEKCLGKKSPVKKNTRKK